MADLERKVYSSYAFKENEREKMKINREIYEELKSKWKIASTYLKRNEQTNLMEPAVNIDDYDLVYIRKAGYGHGEYTIYKNETDLKDDELALIFDGGNLCFGYAKKSSNFFYVFED